MLNTQPKISVIGLGKLGAPMAAVFASSGLDVIGLDTNPQVVEAINQGHAPHNEPLLQDYIEQSQGRLRATDRYQDAVLESDISFIILPTPSDEQHCFSNAYLLEAVDAIGHALREKTGYHLVVITSTTMPGSTDGVIREALEKSSGRVVGERLGLCYNPEFIALGSVIRDMTHPDFILVGESDTDAGDLLERVHQHYLPASTPFRRMSSINAELVKISINTFVTTKISYANMLAELCESLPGADVDTVTQAVGSDSRIGNKYLKGALGYGGPCFPRDNKAFFALGQDLGVNCELAKATDLINDHQVTRLTNIVRRTTAVSQTIAILGLSYKPDTGVIEASQGIQLANELANTGYEVIAFDPMANTNAGSVLNPGIRIADDLQQAIAGVATIVIATPWQEFKTLPPLLDDNSSVMAVIDPWRILDPVHLPPHVSLVQMGAGIVDTNIPDQPLSAAK